MEVDIKNIEPIKILLETEYHKICSSSKFIKSDPIQIPHLFSLKEDIEISGLLTSIISWGQRKAFIKKAYLLMEIMDNSPYDFIMNASEKDVNKFNEFIYRTMNGYDCMMIIRAIINIYRNNGGLENVFTNAWKQKHDIRDAIRAWHSSFDFLDCEARVYRQVANVDKNSAAKKINMFLRWMVRKDDYNIDFGIWKEIPASDLLIPLDVHVGNVARKLGLITRKQNNLKSVIELTSKLRLMDKNDPIKYDFALFGVEALDLQ